MSENEDILLSIKVENSAAVEAVARLQAAITKLNDSTRQLTARIKELEKQMAAMAKQGQSGSAAFKQLTAEVEANRKAIAGNAAAVKSYTAELSANTKQLVENIGKTRAYISSVKELSAELNGLKKTYQDLTAAERESASGKDLYDKIQIVAEALKNAAEAYDIVTRSLRDYDEAMRKASGEQEDLNDKVAETGQTLNQMGGQAGGLGNLLKGGLKSAINSVSGALKALMANPVAALLAVVAAAISGVVKAIKGNEEHMRKLQSLFAPVQVFLGGVSKLLENVADGLMAVVGWIGEGIGGLTSMLEKLPIVGDAIKEINDAAKAEAQLEKEKQALAADNLSNITEQAENEKNVFQLRNEAMRNDKLSAAERLAMMDEAGKIELAQAERNRRLKEEELRLLQEEVRQKGMSAEQEKQIQDLTAEIIRMQINEGQKANELADQRLSFQKSLAEAERKADDERLRREEEYRKLVESGNEQLQKLTLELMSEGLEKEKAVRKAAYEKELASVTGTEEQKAEIRRLLAERYSRDIAAIDEKYSQESLDKAVERRTNQLNAELELAREDADKKLAINLELLEQEKAAAIANAEETGVAVETIEALYAQRAADLEAQAEEERQTARAERLAQLLTDTASQYDEELARIGENAQARADLELEIETAKLEALRNLDEENKALLFESEEAYEDAVREQIKQTEEAQRASSEESKKARLAAIEDAKSKMDSVSDIAGSISDLFSTIAGDNEVMQKFLKGVALFQIGVDMAKAIAGAISGAMTQPFPANIAAVVSGIAAVTAGIVQAKQTLSQQKEEPSPKFAEGGLVTGPGTGTSDSVPAMLSNGESVMTAAATRMFAPMLSAMNVAGGGVPFSVSTASIGLEIDGMMTDSITKAFAAMPAPVVSVEEINTVESRVRATEININA